MRKHNENLDFYLRNRRMCFIILLLVFNTLVLSAQQPAEVYYLKLSGVIRDGQIDVEKYNGSQKKATNKRINPIKLYPNIEFQTFEGFGGAFNEIGGEALMVLPKDKQTEVAKNLFGLNYGAQLTFCRTAVGASDFGIDAYSYSEKADDYNMTAFSIKREETSVIPFIQHAFAQNPNLKLFASPWSPPAWMKYSGLMDQGEDFPEKNKLKDDPKIYKAYALYFSKYIKAYEDKGITIDRLIVQNETDANTPYPSNDMSVSQMSKFVKSYLRPKFNADKIDTEIWAGTFRVHGRIDALELAGNPENLALFDGIGIQYTSSKYIQDMNALYPHGNTMHTEGNCFNGKNTWEQASSRLKEVAQYFNYGIPNYCYWNMILNETTESGWDWAQNSLININRNTKAVTYNPDYGVFAFMSQYLVPGSKRIANYSKDDLISVKHDNKVYVLLQNNKDIPNSYECQIEEGEKQIVTLPAKSLAVIVLNI
ncbi:glycoside hydrolase family 30 protein [Formosa sp. 3Alg 14/1]|uniref:glycoside hydrolase family 30 protein n=1 Tax=Formosa sp. 3Alg 14/1 TaxID=3382190 RepID=UPI0039BEB96E